jgi:predicted nuclease of predicted toxin-antitoxin system
MKWLADECVAALLVRKLRDLGHDVEYIAEIARRSPDVDVIGRAIAEGRLLLTDDKDFGELIVRRGRLPPGLVLLRTSEEQSAIRWERLREAVERFDQELFGRITVIQSNKIRFRPLPPDPS